MGHRILTVACPPGAFTARLCSIAFAVLAAGPAAGASTTLTGFIDSSVHWRQADNWDPPVIPGASDDALIPIRLTAIVDGAVSVNSVAGGGGLLVQAPFAVNANSSIGNYEQQFSSLTLPNGVSFTANQAKFDSFTSVLGQATFRLTGSGTFTNFGFDGDLKVAGNANFSGDLNFNASSATPGTGRLVVESGATADAGNVRWRDVNLTNDPGGGFIRNAGTINFAPATSTSVTVGVVYENLNKIDILQGRVQYSKGGVNESGSKMGGLGTVEFFGGTHHFKAGSELGSAVVKVLGGVLRLDPGAIVKVPQMIVGCFGGCAGAKLELAAGVGPRLVLPSTYMQSGGIVVNSHATIEELNGVFGATITAAAGVELNVNRFSDRAVVDFRGPGSFRNSAGQEWYGLATMYASATQILNDGLFSLAEGEALVLNQGAKVVVRNGGELNLVNYSAGLPTLMLSDDRSGKITVEKGGIVSKIGFGRVAASEIGHELKEGAQLNIKGGTYEAGELTSEGNVSVASGATGVFSSARQAIGTFNNDGVVRLGGDSPQMISGGRLTGGGRFELSRQEMRIGITDGGTVSPGASPGVLTIIGGYVQDATSALDIELGGLAQGGFDVLAVSGDAELHGTLRIIRYGSYAPQLGDSFLVLTYGSHTGEFDNVVLEGFGPGTAFARNWGANGLTLQVAAVPEPETWVLLLAGLVLVGYAASRRCSAIRCP